MWFCYSVYCVLKIFCGLVMNCFMSLVNDFLILSGFGISCVESLLGLVWKIFDIRFWVCLIVLISLLMCFVLFEDLVLGVFVFGLFFDILGVGIFFWECLVWFEVLLCILVWEVFFVLGFLVDCFVFFVLFGGFCKMVLGGLIELFWLCCVCGVDVILFFVVIVLLYFSFWKVLFLELFSFILYKLLVWMICSLCMDSDGEFNLSVV